jgi:hypothetical protein
MNGQVLFKGEIISKMQNGAGSFKNLLQNQRARIGHIYMEAF